MRQQLITENTTGVIGSGTLGGATLDDANTIESNVTGVNFSGIVQYNRIGYNTTGANVSGNLFAHNILYRNTADGILVTGAGAKIYNNTVYAVTGDALRIIGAGAEVRNNALWSRGGYAMEVGINARAGFFSDYNSLYSSDSGKPVYYLKGFDDLIDWQRDVNRYDLHSIGGTQVDPGRARPQFVSIGTDDDRIVPQLAGQRSAARQAMPETFSPTLRWRVRRPTCW